MRPVIVGCGKSKRAYPAPAGMLYTGGYVRDAVHWGLSVTSRDHVFILSAKYGLIRIDTIIAPYNATFSGPSAEPVIQPHILAQQATGFGLHGPVITLAGKHYYQYLTEATGGDIEPYNPFFAWLDARGENHMTGYQRHAMREWHGRIPELQPCPECTQGKHNNCDGNTWSDITDDFDLCPCGEKGHWYDD